MENTQAHNIFKDDNESHVDNREENHHGETPGPHLGFDLGIDVAG
jgi:hypothetical protein